MKPLDPVKVPVTPSTGAYVSSFPGHVHLTLYGDGYQASVSFPLKSAYVLYHTLAAALHEADLDSQAQAKLSETRYWATRAALPSGSYVGD